MQGALFTWLQSVYHWGRSNPYRWFFRCHSPLLVCGYLANRATMDYGFIYHEAAVVWATAHWVALVNPRSSTLLQTIRHKRLGSQFCWSRCPQEKMHKWKFPTLVVFFIDIDTAKQAAISNDTNEHKKHWTNYVYVAMSCMPVNMHNVFDSSRSPSVNPVNMHHMFDLSRSV